MTTVRFECVDCHDPVEIGIEIADPNDPQVAIPIGVEIIRRKFGQTKRALAFRCPGCVKIRERKRWEVLP